jgi:DNA (cytosine-5)-methyltransferase 1
MSASRGQAIELCAGMGGIGIALRSLGYEVVRAFDSWDQAVAIYNHNFGSGKAEECNLLSAAGRERIAEVARRAGDIELLAAGPPCKGFSQLRNGQTDGRNGHNRVLRTMPDYVGLIRPRMFVIENVPDLARHLDGRTLRELVARLKQPTAELSYEVTCETYDAALFGTPQARRRILILGVRSGEGRALPAAGPDLRPLYSAIRHRTKVPKQLKSFLDSLRDPEDVRMTTARQALSDLPILRPGWLDDEADYRTDPTNAYQRLIRANAPKRPRDMRTPAITAAAERRLTFIPQGGCARSIPGEQLNGLSRRYDSAYRRLHEGAPSTALSTKYDCVYHYTQPRSLSVREYARLQSVPDWFTFPQSLAPRRSAYEMIGNSVPPRLVAGVLKVVLGETE